MKGYVTLANSDILCMINAIMQEIIHLKNENRSLSQRMKTLGGEVTKLTLHIAKATTNNKGNLRKRNSYCNLIHMLEQSQNRNSKLILKHRNEIQQLREELI